jgi:hypothetical protein
VALGQPSATLQRSAAIHPTLHPTMFSQQQIETAVENAVAGRFSSDWNVSNGWNHESNTVVYSQSRDYLFFTTDGWRNDKERIRVIKKMRGMAILCLI